MGMKIPFAFHLQMHFILIGFVTNVECCLYSPDHMCGAKLILVCRVSRLVCIGGILPSAASQLGIPPAPADADQPPAPPTGHDPLLLSEAIRNLTSAAVACGCRKIVLADTTVISAACNESSCCCWHSIGLGFDAGMCTAEYSEVVVSTPASAAVTVKDALCKVVHTIAAHSTSLHNSSVKDLDLFPAHKDGVSAVVEASLAWILQNDDTCSDHHVEVTDGLAVLFDGDRLLSINDRLHTSNDRLLDSIFGKKRILRKMSEMTHLSSGEKRSLEVDMIAVQADEPASSLSHTLSSGSLHKISSIKILGHRLIFTLQHGEDLECSLFGIALLSNATLQNFLLHLQSGNNDWWTTRDMSLSAFQHIIRKILSVLLEQSLFHKLLIYIV